MDIELIKSEAFKRFPHHREDNTSLEHERYLRFIEGAKFVMEYKLPGSICPDCGTISLNSSYISYCNKCDKNFIRK